VYGPDVRGETFRVLKEKEIKRSREYRTKRVILELHDEMAGGLENLSKGPDPPPADPRVAHSWETRLEWAEQGNQSGSRIVRSESMSQPSPVRVVQCPKCGSPVQGSSAGGYITCTFCTASLQVYEGASGNAMARLATIETSTLYLAKTEALKELRRELEEKQATLADVQDYRVRLGAWVTANRPEWFSGRSKRDDHAEALRKFTRAELVIALYAQQCARLEALIKHTQAELRDMARRL
jgi:uncharacterized Zn finger protein (UPF0148 family)